MTKKEELFKDYEELKDKGIECVCLFIHMPAGETEVITNPNVADKMAYVDKTYDDDLYHSNCNQIYIEDYVFSLVEDTFDFGSAVENLKEGHKVARKGWNGKGMFLFLADSADIETKADLSCVSELKGELVLPTIVMKTADNRFCVGWLASQTDMLAEDWYIVD